MAWPIAQQNLATALAEVHNQVIQASGVARGEITNLASLTNANKIIEIYQTMTIFDRTLERAAVVPGIAAYARGQFDNPSFNAASEFTAIRALLQAVIAQIEGDVPTAGGFLQTHSFTSGEYLARTFTPAQTANLRAALQNLVDAIG